MPFAARRWRLPVVVDPRSAAASANGEISKWFGTCTDIEQIKVAEQRLKESEAKFSGIVSISADAIISIDDEQRITIFNNGAEQIFGYSKAEAMGLRSTSSFPSGFAAPIASTSSGLRRRETARRMGERLTTIAGLRKNGEEFPAEAAISKLQVGDKTTPHRGAARHHGAQALREGTAVSGRSGSRAGLLRSTTSRRWRPSLDLVVQNFADWCAVDVVDEHGHLRRLKVASADPAKAALCAVLEQMPPDRDLPHLMRSVVESKRPVLIEHVTSEYIESLAQGPEHLQALLATGVTSFVAVPLLMRGQPLGALFFGSSTPSRVYRTGRSSSGRSAGGPGGYRDRECTSLPRFGPRHPTP